MSAPTRVSRFRNNKELGVSIGLLWATKTSWMHRRVDIVEFCDATTLRFQVIIDMTVPEDAVIPVLNEGESAGITGINGHRAVLLPIAMIEKKKTSIAFTLTDEEGRELSRLSALEACELGAYYLKLIAVGILGEAGHAVSHAESFRILLSRLCRPGSTRDAEKAWQSLLRKPEEKWGLTRQARRCLIDNPDFLRWAHIFAEQYFLCVLLEGTPGQQRIIRFSFESETSDAQRAGRRRPRRPDRRRDGKVGSKRNLSTRLGLKSTKYHIPASGAGDCASYHCEIIHPSGVGVKRIRMVAGFLEDPDSLTKVKIQCGTNELRSHIVAARQRDPFGIFRLVVSFRVKWQGWLKAAALLGYGIAIFMILSGFLYQTYGGGTGLGISVDAGTLVGALLLGVGAACITVLVRVNEHQLTAHLMQSFRAVMVVLLALVFGVVLVLAFADVFILKMVFFIAGVVALIGATLLALPWLQGVPRQMRRAVRQMRRAVRSFWKG